MTGLTRNDELRQYFVEAAVDGVPPDLLGRSLERTRTARQRRHAGWFDWRRALPGVRASTGRLRLAYAAGLVAVLVGALVVGSVMSGGLTPTPTPSRTPSPSATPSLTPTPSPTVTLKRVTSFVRPFEYEEVVGAPTIGPVAGGLDLVLFSRGIAIGSAEHAWTHDCRNGGRSAVRSDPRGFMDDLQEIGGVFRDTDIPTTLDGRPALQSDVRGSTCGFDIHVSGPMTGLVGNAGVDLTKWARIIVADIDGITVFVHIAEESDAPRGDGLPEAMRFVESIHFLDTP